MMKALIAYTRERALENRTFTGAYIVREGEIIWKTVTTIEPDKNPLAHAELKALQRAILDYGPSLAGCHPYTTQQPCPMCASAIVWSGVEKVVYGVPSSAQWKTFDHVHKFFADSGTECVGPVLERECRKMTNTLSPTGFDGMGMNRCHR